MVGAGLLLVVGCWLLVDSRRKANTCHRERWSAVTTFVRKRVCTENGARGLWADWEGDRWLRFCCGTQRLPRGKAWIAVTTFSGKRVCTENGASGLWVDWVRGGAPFCCRLFPWQCTKHAARYRYTRCAFSVAPAARSPLHPLILRVLRGTRCASRQIV